MHPRLWLLAALLACPAIVVAGDKAPIQDLLAQAGRQVSLLEDSPQPFLLEMDFTAQAKTPVQGHLRVRWEAKDRWWSKISMAGFEQVKFQNGDRTWTVRNVDFTPAQVIDLFTLTHVAGGYEKLVARKDKQRVEGGVPLDCIESQPLDNKTEQRELCLDSATHDVVSDTRRHPDDDEVHRYQFADFAGFAGHRYPRKLEFLKNGKTEISATVTALREEPLDPQLLVPPSGAIERRECADKKPPRPIGLAELNLGGHGAGEITFEMTILTDGSVGAIHVVRKAGNLDDAGVMPALKKGKYQPAYCGAEPVVDDVTISIRTTQ